MIAFRNGNVVISEGKARIHVAEADVYATVVYHLMERVYRKIGPVDDAGCDWYTDAKRRTYIAERDWKVSDDPTVADIIDAVNVIKYNEPLRLQTGGVDGTSE